MALVIIVCSNCVMIFKINFFQFSNSNSEKYLNRFYYNYVKGKKHNFEKIWWIYHKVLLHTLLNSSPKL